jgi:hypothetical protein
MDKLGQKDAAVSVLDVLAEIGDTPVAADSTSH